MFDTLVGGLLWEIELSGISFKTITSKRRTRQMLFLMEENPYLLDCWAVNSPDCNLTRSYNPQSGQTHLNVQVILIRLYLEAPHLRSQSFYFNKPLIKVTCGSCLMAAGQSEDILILIDVFEALNMLVSLPYTINCSTERQGWVSNHNTFLDQKLSIWKTGIKCQIHILFTSSLMR